ncbi:MAG: DNA polymerase III subunit delta' [Clostridia bacterium]|nr:DNA polymerase III subunit delta' [Clostridia bacterium]
MLSYEDFKGQSAHIGQLQSSFAAKTNVHAYMLCGPRGTGKKSVARLCAMAAVCRGEGKKPCGACGPCRRILSDTHPDVHTVQPEKGKQAIGVNVLRDVLAEVGVKSFEASAKVLIFPEAERMTPAAQNCLLKTLEEPPQDTVFFLITEQPGSLLPTIVSRCRVIRFHPLSQEDCEKRLCALGLTQSDAKRRARMAEGCVGKALEIDEERLALMEKVTRDVFSVHRSGDVLSVVNLYKDDKQRQNMVMDLLESAVRDILLAQAGSSPLEDGGYAREAESFARAVPLSGGLALASSIARARMMLASNVSFAAAFESVLLKISEEYTKWPW